MPRLFATPVPPNSESHDPRIHQRLMGILADHLEAGDAIAPYDASQPKEFQDAALRAISPTHIYDSDLRDSSVYRGRASVAADLAEGDALAMQTSGSSGAPKVAVLTLDAITRAACLTNQASSFNSAACRWATSLPLNHMGGFGVLLRSHFGFVEPLVIQNTQAAHDEALRAGATHVSVVPTLLRRLDLHKFQKVLVGGAPLNTRGFTNIIKTYGMTETCGGVVYDGVALPGVDIALDDDGEILIKSPTNMRAYRAEGPEARRDWIRSGDLGRLVDGRLEVVGRISEVINTGGEKVSPTTVEIEIRKSAGVEEVKVVGVTDDLWGEVVVAFLVTTEAFDSVEELRQKLKESLPAYCVPKHFFRLRQLPLLDSGKPDTLAMKTVAQQALKG